MASLPPELVPSGYEAGEPLGSGPWSRYARARRTADGAAVVLGLIDTGLAPVEPIVAQLRTLAGPDSFPAPQQAGTIPGTSVVWYAYEGVGAPASARLSSGTLSADEAAALGIAAALLLDGRGPVSGYHGAICPAVLLWDGTRASILDAGIARVALDARLPPTGGSGPYLAPEVLIGEKPTEHGDMYGLGASLYELMTGRPPFGGRTTSTVMATVLAEGPREPSDNEHDANYVVDAVLRAIEKDPEDRWPTLATFAAALAGERPTTPPKAGEAVRPRRLGCLPALLAAIAGACLAR